GAAPPADPAKPEAAAPPSTALERMRNERASAAERQQRIANAEAEISRLTAKIDNLKR
ncbi:MAG: hypothetical protein GWN07_18175, partial [Actinobacteria bacterium]|nr:hypothetical protein [Actinomycetota bacterium]NIS32321.1 hypothetical protein [Actinomycetota bacterium]NIU67351.1 hypothetical protein [Actinomycetota bacterium]NIW29130.1 hypothetical protein [Actinomycetota bacterium]NIX21659.1 hypothetical protein [Actinomycetota bacterium]